jgi:hypothetical protein
MLTQSLTAPARTDRFPAPLSPFAWGVGYRIAVVLALAAGLWAAVGWAAGWWG